MTEADFKKIADLLKHAAGHCEDGVDACGRRDVDQLCTALIYAHEALHHAFNVVTEATRRKQNDSDAGALAHKLEALEIFIQRCKAEMSNG